MGKGDAVRKGFAAATGDVLMILDADLTVPPEELPKFLKTLASGRGEFVHGSRLVYPMEKQAMRFLNTLGNKFFSLAFTWLLDQRFKDTLCGTKVLYRRDYERIAAGRGYFGDFDPFGDFDLIFGAAKLDLKIVEIPIRYRERTYGINPDLPVPPRVAAAADVPLRAAPDQVRVTLCRRTTSGNISRGSPGSTTGGRRSRRTTTASSRGSTGNMSRKGRLCSRSDAEQGHFSMRCGRRGALAWISPRRW